MGTDDVAVVMAYRDLGVPERRRSFAHVHAWYQDHGYRVVVEAGESDAQFTRARAINAGVRRAGAAVIVQSDPDALVPAQALHAAVGWTNQPGLIFPHDGYLCLTLRATDDVLTGRRAISDVGPEDCEESGPNGSGGVVVFTYETWEQAGGFDERFGLWGGDDAAFAYAAAAFCGPARRVIGDMVHLWHPRLPQSEIGSPGYLQQFALLAQYRDAAAEGPEAVRRLVESR